MVPSEFEVAKSPGTLKFNSYHKSLMGYRRVWGGFRRMPKPTQISAETHQISHGNNDIFWVSGWLATSNLAGNTVTPVFDVFPGRLSCNKISDRLFGKSWIMNIWNYTVVKQLLHEQFETQRRNLTKCATSFVIAIDLKKSLFWLFKNFA